LTNSCVHVLFCSTKGGASADPAKTQLHREPELSDKFFDERKDQSEVKARIVSKYFLVWANVVAPTARARGECIAYIDLFAGPGRYKDGSASTPLMVVERAIQDPKLRGMLVTKFNDEDPENTTNLRDELNRLPGIADLRHAPEISTGSVGDQITALFQTVKLVPSFSFIDPFGYIGLSLGLIRGAIKDWGCDCVFFFNFARINAGLPNEKVEKHMNALFGKERADGLRLQLKGLAPPEREALIVETLAEAIKEMGGRFVLPFRFRNASGKRTTHHLVFVCKHEKGYEIMKEIMAKESSTQDQGVASFDYSPADERMPLLFSLTRKAETLNADLLKTFSGQSLTMLDIYKRHHIDTPFIKRNYKDALLHLELSGQITAAPGKRKPGTFADSVTVTFPQLKV
jgi:three-Cys-motif partner protein